MDFYFLQLFSIFELYQNIFYFSGAGNHIRDDVIFNTIQLVSNAPDLQPYVVHEAWKAIRDTQHCTEKQPLTQVSCWCIGEYGAGLLNGVSVDGETITVSEQEVIGKLLRK